MSRTRSHQLLATLLCALALPAGSAQAFSDPFSFNLTPVAAGGGGRFFTGSPGDSYTCKTCHSGGPSPKASVLGLPLSGYRPSSRYEVSIRWPEEFTKISLAVELTDDQGKAAGSLLLPPEGSVQPGELCEPVEEQVVAAQLNDVVAGRQIINVPDCGSKSVRFLWTAPATDVGPVWFAGSMVLSDGESDPFHDGVTDFGRIIESPALASATAGECSVSRVGIQAAHGSLTWLGIFVALAVCGSRRRRRATRLRAGCTA
jgi:hypothetical protein